MTNLQWMALTALGAAIAACWLHWMLQSLGDDTPKRQTESARTQQPPMIYIRYRTAEGGTAEIKIQNEEELDRMISVIESLKVG